MIIGLMGLKGSGKDTVGAYLVKKYDFERKSFADPMKRSFAALFDIPMHEIETLKNADNATIAIEFEQPLTGFPEDEGRTKIRPISSMSFRQALQRYGTESHRDVFGENFWLDQALPVEGFYSGRKIVVTDCRFENEYSRIKSLGGIIVRVERPGLDETDTHSGENKWKKLKVDFVIANAGGIYDLYENIESMLGMISGF